MVVDEIMSRYASKLEFLKKAETLIAALEVSVEMWSLSLMVTQRNLKLSSINQYSFNKACQNARVHL